MEAYASVRMEKPMAGTLSAVPTYLIVLFVGNLGLDGNWHVFELLNKRLKSFLTGLAVTRLWAGQGVVISARAHAPHAVIPFKTYQILVSLSQHPSYTNADQEIRNNIELNDLKHDFEEHLVQLCHNHPSRVGHTSALCVAQEQCSYNAIRMQWNKQINKSSAKTFENNYTLDQYPPSQLTPQHQ